MLSHATLKVIMASHGSMYVEPTVMSWHVPFLYELDEGPDGIGGGRGGGGGGGIGLL